MVSLYFSDMIHNMVIVYYEPVSRKIKNSPNRTLITIRGEAEVGKLRFGLFFIYGQGSQTILLRQWRENTSFPIVQRPGNTCFLAANKKKCLTHMNICRCLMNHSANNLAAFFIIIIYVILLFKMLIINYS